LFKKGVKIERKRRATKEDNCKKNCMFPQTKPPQLRKFNTLCLSLQREGGKKVHFILRFVLQLPSLPLGEKLFGIVVHFATPGDRRRRKREKEQGEEREEGKRPKLKGP